MDKKTEADLTSAGREKLEEYKSYPDEMFAAAAAAGSGAAGGGAAGSGAAGSGAAAAEGH